MTRRIVVVQAGLGQPSSSRLLADRLAAATSDALLARGERAEVTVVDVREHAHGLADALLTGFATGALREALDAVAAADGVIVVSPVFQASFSGLFKSFVDVLDDGALKGTPVLLAATAGTARHSLVLEHALRPVFTHLKAVTVPTAVFAAAEDWGSTGAAGSGLKTRVGVAADELADLVAGVRQPRRGATDLFADPVPFEELLAR
jgi:FMN reductase